MSRGMLALVAGLGTGYLKGQDQARQQGQEDEDRAQRKTVFDQQQEDRTYNMSERARALQLRTDLGAAGAPVVADSSPVAVPIGSQDTPQAPEDRGTRVGGKTYYDPSAATMAATAANAPGAAASRMSDVLLKAGDPVAAQTLRAGAMTEQTGGLALDAAKREDIKQKFIADKNSKVKDWGSLAQFMSDSGGDGNGGATKFSANPSADGKTMVISEILPDGSLKPAKSFPNSTDGLMQASAMLEGLSGDKMLTHLHQNAVLAQTVSRDKSQADYHTGMLKNAGDLTAAKIEIATMRASAAAAAQAAKLKPAEGMTFADLKDGHKGIASTLNSDYKTQIESTTDPVALKAIKTARENEIATAQRLYTGAMQSGFALTPEQAIVAFRSGEAGSQTYKKKDGSGTITVNGVMYGGRFIPMADNPGAMPGAAEKKPPAAAKTPAEKQASAIPVNPDVVAPAAEPEQPGAMARVASKVRSTLDAGSETGRQSVAIQARVREADNGGNPLTAAERAVAKRFGIVPLT